MRYWSGFLSATCLISLFQDLLGHDWLMAHAWVAPEITVPLALAGWFLSELMKGGGEK
jgi:hypothetical protein